MYELAQGPLYKTQRVEFSGTDSFRGGKYVEVRQERTARGVRWEVEHGSLRFGFSGAWGRNNLWDAMRTFGYAVEYATR